MSLRNRNRNRRASARIAFVAAAASVASIGAGLWQTAMGGTVDWHINPGGTNFGDGQTANWTPYGGTNTNNAGAQSNSAVNGISYSIWDDYGPHGNAAVGTSHNINDFGGQQFDAKAMYATTDGNDLYVGVVTGMGPTGARDPRNNNVNIVPGDLAINPDWANSTAQYGVKFDLTPLNNNGQAVGLTTLATGGNWNVPDQAVGFKPGSDTNMQNGQTTVASDIGYNYQQLNVTYHDDATGKNQPIYLYDFSIPLSDIDAKPGETFNFSWGPGCNNDNITDSFTMPGLKPAFRPEIQAIPLPAAAVMWPATAALAAACARRMRKQQANAQA
jgi:hypothetical protein